MKGMGCEPVLNFSVSPDEDVSIICNVVEKLYFQLWEKLMYVSYTTDRPGSIIGHPEGALALICLWVI
jgi:hypothetical protein